MHTLVIIRHGESQWNKLNLFCGWTDVDLTETGYEEAHQAGRLLREENYHFDICYTSVLKRAIHTAYTVLDELDLAWIPMVKDYHLNERHYGALQGLNKKETAEKYGGYADFSARNGIFRANVFIPLEDMDLRLSDKAG
mgnify:FL=1